MILVASLAPQLPGPQSDPEHAELAAAIQQLAPDADSWALRDANDILRPQADRETFVDLAAHARDGRVSWHRSMSCNRPLGGERWVCRDVGTVVAVARPANDQDSNVPCPAADTGIQVDDSVPIDLVPELTDFVRFNMDTRSRVRATCSWRNEPDASFPPPVSCDVDSIKRIAPNRFDVGIRMRAYSWRHVLVAQECDEADCDLRLVDCHGWDF